MKEHRCKTKDCDKLLFNSTRINELIEYSDKFDKFVIELKCSRCKVVQVFTLEEILFPTLQ